MNDKAIGRTLAAIRREAGLRQADLATRVGVSQQLISSLERGGVARVQLATLRRCFVVLDASLVTTPYWRGGDLDRLLDEDHAKLVARAARMLEGLGWTVHPEVTYAIWGERGSVDLLAWHHETRTLLVVEVKTALHSVEETLRRHDSKVRLATRIWADRGGPPAMTVGGLLVILDTPTNRRRAARHDQVLRRAYPRTGEAARAWLRQPGPGAAHTEWAGPGAAHAAWAGHALAADRAMIFLAGP